MTIHLYKHKNVFLIDQNYRRHRWIKIKLWNKPKQEVLREDSKKKTNYLMTSIKRVGGYLAEITIS